MVTVLLSVVVVLLLVLVVLEFVVTRPTVLELVGKIRMLAERDKELEKRCRDGVADERKLRENLSQSLEAHMSQQPVKRLAALLGRLEEVAAGLRALEDRVILVESAMESWTADATRRAGEAGAAASRAEAEAAAPAAAPAAPRGEADPAPPADDELEPAEKAALKREWSEFEQSFPELVAAAGQQAEKAAGGAWHELLLELPRALADLPELRLAAEEILAMPRERHQQLHQLALIPKWLGDDQGGSSPSVRRRRIQEARQLLTALAAGERAGEPALTLDSFVRGPFLGFADHLLRACQQAEAEGRGTELAAGREIVLRLLRHAQVAAVEIVLGTTPFDPALHRGRSLVSESRYPEGVVVSVVRNGFRDLRQRCLLVRPEVVVNRLNG